MLSNKIMFNWELEASESSNFNYKIENFRWNWSLNHWVYHIKHSTQCFFKTFTSSPCLYLFSAIFNFNMFCQLQCKSYILMDENKKGFWYVKYPKPCLLTLPYFYSFQMKVLHAHLTKSICVAFPLNRDGI